MGAAAETTATICPDGGGDDCDGNDDGGDDCDGNNDVRPIQLQTHIRFI